MLLRELRLENFGLYRGEQTVTFSTDTRKPITLMGERNGTGKTHSLDAIPLVLFGSRSRSWSTLRHTRTDLDGSIHWTFRTRLYRWSSIAGKQGFESLRAVSTVDSHQ